MQKVNYTYGDLLDEFVNNYDEVPYKFPHNKYVDLGEKNYNSGYRILHKF